jgi:transposase
MFAPVLVEGPALPVASPPPEPKPRPKKTRERTGGIELEIDGVVVRVGRGAEVRTVAAVIKDEMRADPFSGVIHVFRAKRADRIKLLYWDGTGVVLVAKTLEQGGFRWPRVQDGVMRLTASQLGALLDGLDWARVYNRRRTRAPIAAH